MSAKSCYFLAFIAYKGGKTTTGEIEREHWGGKRAVTYPALNKLMSIFAARGFIEYEKYGRITMTTKGFERVGEIFEVVDDKRIPRLWRNKLKELKRKTNNLYGE